MSKPESCSTEADRLLRILTNVQSIAIVGASGNATRPSYGVMEYLQRKGFRTIPVNPRNVGSILLGELVYASLREIPESIDMVDIFRDPRFVEPIVQDAIAVKARVVWMQLGVVNETAAAMAAAAGLEVVMDRCPKIELERAARG